MAAKKKTTAKKPVASKAKASAKKAVKKAPAKKPVAKKPAPKAKTSSVAKTLKKLVKKVTSALKVKPKAKPAAKKPAKPVKKVAAKKPVAKKAPAPKQKAKPVVAKVVAKPVVKAPVKATPSKQPAPKPTTAKKKPFKGSNEPGKTSYSDTELQEFRELITQKIQAAREELKYLQEQINRTSAVGDTESDTTFSGLEDGTGTMEREYLNQMASRQITYIGHLEKALMRIENKTYGICRETGNLIPKERLRAVPHATLSIEAKMAKD